MKHLDLKLLAAPALIGLAQVPANLETKDDPPAGDSPADPPSDTAEIKQALDGFMQTFDAFDKKTKDELAQMKKSMDKRTADVVTQDEVKKLNDALDEQKKIIDDLRLAERRPQIDGPDGQKRTLTEAEVKHAEAAMNYIRKGDEAGLRELEAKALSVGSDPDGGYMVPMQMESTVDRVLSEVSPIRAIATVQQISTAVYKRPVNMSGTGTGWVGESAGRPETATPTLRERTFPAMELYAMPAATQSLLDDAAINIEQWLADEVQIAFAEQEGNAFVLGDGVDKPRGFISGYTHVDNDNFTEASGGCGYVATGTTGAFKTTADGDDSDNLIDLVYSLKSGYRQGARFVMNRKTQGEVRKIQDADGNKIWQPGLQNGQPASLLGYPITEAEDMPDIAADSFSIAFGDFRRGYLIVDRVGIRILRDPFSSKPYVLFYTTKRVGGGVKMFEPIKLLKFGTS